MNRYIFSHYHFGSIRSFGVNFLSFVYFPALSGDQSMVCVGMDAGGLAFFATYDPRVDIWTRNLAHEATVGPREGAAVVTNTAGDKAYIINGHDGAAFAADVRRHKKCRDI